MVEAANQKGELTMADDEYWAEYKGIECPRYTQIPDVMLDGLLPRLGHAEFKVAMYIARKTFGWGKDSDSISLPQLQKGTNLGDAAVKRAVKSLEEKGVLQVARSKTEAGGAAVNVYSLVIKGGRVVKTPPPGVVKTPPLQETAVNKKQERKRRGASSSSLDNQNSGNDKTTLINSLAAEFAPGEPEQAILTYLGRFPPAWLLEAAEVTRQAADGLDRPIAYLYGVLQKMAEQENLIPLYHLPAQPLRELTEEERAASLAELDRVKAALREAGIIGSED